MFVLDDNQTVNRKDARSSIPIRFDLFDVGEQLRVGPGLAACRRVHVPVADRRTGTADTGRPGEASLNLARCHHALQRFTWTGMDHIRRQRQCRNVLFVIYDPGHLGRDETIFIDEDAAKSKRRLSPNKRERRPSYLRDL